MPVKMPTEISLKWWDKNAPDSLPRNKEIAKALKAIQTTPKTRSIQAINDAEEIADQKKAIKDHLEPYKTLIDELKRYRAVVTKTKDSHNDFLEAIDRLTRMAKADLGELTDVAKTKLTEAQAANTSNARVLASLQGDGRDLATLRRKIGDLHRQTLGAADKDTLAEVIGQNRKLQQTVKETLKSADKQAGKVAEPDDEVTQALESVRATIAALMKLARAVDKAMVLKAVEVLGTDKGKKLFLETKAATSLR